MGHGLDLISNMLICVKGLPSLIFIESGKGAFWRISEAPAIGIRRA